jgi:hypothetical protein
VRCKDPINCPNTSVALFENAQAVSSAWWKSLRKCVCQTAWSSRDHQAVWDLTKQYTPYLKLLGFLDARDLTNLNLSVSWFDWKLKRIVLKELCDHVILRLPMSTQKNSLLYFFKDKSYHNHFYYNVFNRKY